MFRGMHLSHRLDKMSHKDLDSEMRPDPERMKKAVSCNLQPSHCTKSCLRIMYYSTRTTEAAKDLDPDLFKSSSEAAQRGSMFTCRLWRRWSVISSTAPSSPLARRLRKSRPQAGRRRHLAAS